MPNAEAARAAKQMGAPFAADPRGNSPDIKIVEDAIRGNAGR